MKIKNCFLLLMITALAACNSDNEGATYSVHKAGAPVQTGEFLKTEQVQSHNGQVLMSTKGRMPMYQSYDTVSMIPEAYQAYTGLKIGDTVSYEILIDSSTQIAGRKIALNGGKIKVSSKIIDILPDQESLIADMDVTKRKLDAARRK